MTGADLIHAVQQGAHTVPQLAAALNVAQWDEHLTVGLTTAVLRQELVAVGGGRYDLPDGAR